MKLCDYGCEQEAKYQMKNGKWCCSQKWQQCSYYRKQKSENMIGEKNHFYGKNHDIESKRKISLSHLGKKLSYKTRIKMGLSRKNTLRGSDNPMFGKKNKDSPRWNGGYYNKNIPLYNTYADQISFIEDIKRNKVDNNILEVKCSVCKEWFVPTRTSVYERIRAINSGICENKFYCSDECKNKCTVYKKHLYQSDHPKKNEIIYTQEEYQTFREFVLERDNCICQYCGEKAEHVHHERPQKLEPFHALDPDLAWSVCKECHYKYGHKDECSTGNLANIYCK